MDLFLQAADFKDRQKVRAEDKSAAFGLLLGWTEPKKKQRRLGHLMTENDGKWWLMMVNDVKWWLMMVNDG